MISGIGSIFDRFSKIPKIYNLKTFHLTFFRINFIEDIWPSFVWNTLYISFEYCSKGLIRLFIKINFRERVNIHRNISILRVFSLLYRFYFCSNSFPYTGWVPDLYIYFKCRYLGWRESNLFFYFFFGVIPIQKTHPWKILNFSYISQHLHQVERFLK